MPSARSRVTVQGQVSLPAAIRRKLGVGPGSVLEWEVEGDHAIMRRAGQYTSEALHAALFPAGRPAAKTLGDLRQGIRDSVRKRRARR